MTDADNRDLDQARLLTYSRETLAHLVALMAPAMPGGIPWHLLDGREQLRALQQYDQAQHELAAIRDQLPDDVVAGRVYPTRKKHVALAGRAVVLGRKCRALRRRLKALGLDMARPRVTAGRIKPQEREGCAAAE